MSFVTSPLRRVRVVLGLLALVAVLGVATMSGSAGASTLFDQSYADPMATVTFLDTQQSPAAICSPPSVLNGQLVQRIGVLGPTRVQYWYRNATTYYHTQWQARLFDVQLQRYVWDSSWIQETDYRSNPVGFPVLGQTSPWVSYAHTYVATVELRWISVTGNVTAYKKFQHDYYRAYNSNGSYSVLRGQC